MQEQDAEALAAMQAALAVVREQITEQEHIRDGRAAEAAAAQRERERRAAATRAALADIPFSRTFSKSEAVGGGRTKVATAFVLPGEVTATCEIVRCAAASGAPPVAEDVAVSVSLSAGALFAHAFRTLSPTV